MLEDRCLCKPLSTKLILWFTFLNSFFQWPPLMHNPPTPTLFNSLMVLHKLAPKHHVKPITANKAFRTAVMYNASNVIGFLQNDLNSEAPFRSIEMKQASRDQFYLSLTIYPMLVIIYFCFDYSQVSCLIFLLLKLN